MAAAVLAGRGFTDPEAARDFLECSAAIPDPFLFGHMDAVADLVSGAIDRKERIVVHGDYDADGITATALMILALRDLGAEPEWYLPSRFNEGYGLSRTAVESIAAGGQGVLITVDCGVNYPDEVDLAKSLGLKVIVVDHHQPGPRLPDCHVVHSAVGQYPHTHLCGVGLAFKVMHAVHAHRCGAMREAIPEALHSFLDLVAIGTIADLASLQGENRYYVKEGLKLIGIGSRPGLRALAAVANCTGGVDSSAVAFRLAPRLNAAGRLADASPPLRLLLTEDEKEAAEIAGRLHELNGTRQEVERQILDEAVGQIEGIDDLPPIIVLAGESWHEGVVGIVASRLAERYHRPAILLAVREGVAKGSGRTGAAYDLMNGLNACAQHLKVYGGHRQAVGLTLEEDQVDGFRRAIEDHARAAIRLSDLVPAYQADAIISGEEITADTAVALASIGPFGAGNPRPRLLLVGAVVAQPEATRTGSHLRCTVEVDGIRAKGIGFGMAEAVSSLRQGGEGLTLGVQFRVDEWQGSLRPEFLLEKVGAMSGDDGQPYCCHLGCVHNEPFKPVQDTSLTKSPMPLGTAKFEFTNARDLRERPGRLTALAQVIATREPAVILSSSVSQAMCKVRRLPFREWTESSLQCVGRGCWRSSEQRARSADVLVVEWDVVGRMRGLLEERTHVIAVDPPYRAWHVSELNRLASEGALVHLCYGDEDRQETARLLRYLVHPRFAMVCLYRAIGDGLIGEQAFLRAAELAWEQGQVVLSQDELHRAHRILKEMGNEQSIAGEARIEARMISAYASGEAEYEECSRLCLTL